LKIRRTGVQSVTAIRRRVLGDMTTAAGSGADFHFGLVRELLVN